MPYEESRTWSRGSGEVHYYDEQLQADRAYQALQAHLKTVVRPEDMPWESSCHGRIKHVINERMATRLKTLDVYMQELPPGGRSGRHRHMAEEVFFVLEGRGYDLHWDVDVEIGERYVWRTAEEPRVFDWQEGDLVYIPINTVHQHFNADPERPARILSAVNRMYRYIGYQDLEQIEDAPPPA